MNNSRRVRYELFFCVKGVITLSIKCGLLKITAFETMNELTEITGLTINELRDHGFDLDDWDVGFCCNQPLYRKPTPKEIAEFGYGEDDTIYAGETARWLVQRMDDYCVGSSFTEYNSQYFYLVHHA